MRDARIDRWKGILIFLVVLGHAVGMASHYAIGFEKSLLEFIYKVIYLFHMPAFFFVAGVVQNNKTLDLPKKFRRLMYPYFIWGCASILPFMIVSLAPSVVTGSASDSYYTSSIFANKLWQPFVSLLHAGGWPSGNGFRCNSVLWFLPCMFVTSIAYNRISRMLDFSKRKNLLSMIVIGVCIILGGYLRFRWRYTLPWGLSIMPYYLAFMLLGSLIGRKLSLKIDRLSGVKSICLFAALLIAYILASFVIPDRWLAYSQWKWYFVELMIGFFGCMVSMIGGYCIFNHSIWAKLGRDSLSIMLTHKFVVVACSIIVCRFVQSAHSIIAILITILSIAVSCCVAAGARKIVPIVIGEVRR